MPRRATFAELRGRGSCVRLDLYEKPLEEPAQCRLCETVHRHPIDDCTDTAERRLIRGEQRDHRPAIIDRFYLEIGGDGWIDVLVIDGLPRELNAPHGQRTRYVRKLGDAKTNIFDEVKSRDVEVEVGVSLVHPVHADSAGCIKRRERLIREEPANDSEGDANRLVELNVLFVHPPYRSTDCPSAVGAWDPSLLGPLSRDVIAIPSLPPVPALAVDAV